jgi:hypothetical protein
MESATAKSTSVPSADGAPPPIGRIVATERRPNTPHEFHFWTALDAAVGIGTIVRVVGTHPVAGRIPTVYGVVIEGFSYTDLASPLHDVLGHDGAPERRQPSAPRSGSIRRPCCGRYPRSPCSRYRSARFFWRTRPTS